MSTPQHAIDAANEIGAQLNSWLRDWTSADITNEAFAAIIASHPDPELARLREERNKLAGFYDEIVSSIGHDRIINEYNQRGRMLAEEANWRKEAESERDQLRAEVAEWKSAHASELSKRIASDYLLDQANTKIKELETENARLRDALTKLRDCDWVISLPDRMDAVRNIARDALAASKETKP